jgi:hypothetical protein
MMKMRGYVKYAIVGLGALTVISGCVSYSKVIKNEPVSSIPDKKYEKIIRLDTPESKPLKSDAGFVYVEPEGKVTTDFPREEFVKNLDSLDKYAQLNRNNMGKFVIKDSKGRVRGYYEMLLEYTAVIWEHEDDILLQVIIPNSMDGNNGEAGTNVFRTGGGRSGGK